MVGIILLILYIIGCLVCASLCWKINKKSKEKLNIFEIMMDVYFVLLSWVGVFALLAGQVAGFHELHRDNRNKI